jgi:hypothetical protein
MQRELKIKLLPNNQVTLFRQWVNRRTEERFSARPDYSKEPEHIKEYYRNGQARFDRERKKTHETIRVPYYRADGTIRYRLLRIEIPRSHRADLSGELGAALPPLDITKKSQRKARSLAGWGELSKPKNFGHRAGQKIRECGAMMDKLAPTPEYCRVITLTLAGDTPEAFEAIAKYSGYAVNRIFQPIRRIDGDDVAWFFVWEYQKRGALHLHIALFHPDKAVSKECGDTVIIKWIEVLKDIQERSGVDMFVRRDRKSYASPENYQNVNQEMRKSCGGYFSKYAGKAANSKENNYVRRFSKKYPPSRFWGSNRTLKEMCKKFSYESILETELSEIESHADRIRELILLFNPVKYDSFSWKKRLNEGTEREVIISEGEAEVFYLPPARYEELLNALRGGGHSI